MTSNRTLKIKFQPSCDRMAEDSTNFDLPSCAIGNGLCERVVSRMEPSMRKVRDSKEVRHLIDCGVEVWSASFACMLAVWLFAEPALEGVDPRRWRGTTQ